jgi:hypothetical protein
MSPKRLFAALLLVGIFAASVVTVVSLTASPSNAEGTTSDCGGGN